jgi:hypothetical protein
MNGEYSVNNLVAVNAYILNRPTPSFATHTQILQNLLSIKDEQARITQLTLYIIATCHKKMKHRLGTTLSQTYLKSLKQVPLEDISFQKTH